MTGISIILDYLNGIDSRETIGQVVGALTVPQINGLAKAIQAKEDDYDILHDITGLVSHERCFVPRLSRYIETASIDDHF